MFNLKVNEVKNKKFTYKKKTKGLPYPNPIPSEFKPQNEFKFSIFGNKELLELARSKRKNWKIVIEDVSEKEKEKEKINFEVDLIDLTINSR